MTLPPSSLSLQVLREELYLEPRPSPWTTHPGPTTDCVVPSFKMARAERWTRWEGPTEGGPVVAQEADHEADSNPHVCVHTLTPSPRGPAQ